MRTADLIIAWIMVLLGLIYISAIKHEFTPEVMWYLGSGLLIILVGLLNLIRIRHSHAAPGLRWFLVITNLTFACFAFFLGKAQNLSVPGAILAVLALVEAALGVRPGIEPAK
jgi:hypothetical protein